MNVQALLKQAQKMQSDLIKAEKKLENKIYQEENDFVCIKCDGKCHIQSIEFKEDKKNDIEMLQDMTAVAVNKLIEQVNQDREELTKNITSGVKLPGVF